MTDKQATHLNWHKRNAVQHLEGTCCQGGNCSNDASKHLQNATCTCTSPHATNKHPHSRTGTNEMQCSILKGTCCQGGNCSNDNAGNKSTGCCMQIYRMLHVFACICTSAHAINEHATHLNWHQKDAVQHLEGNLLPEGELQQ